MNVVLVKGVGWRAVGELYSEPIYDKEEGKCLRLSVGTKFDGKEDFILIPEKLIKEVQNIGKIVE